MKKSKYYMWLPNSTDNSAAMSIYIYDYITSDGYGDAVNSKRLINALSSFTGDTINIFVNSAGGEVYEAYAIATQLLRAEKAGKTVTCYIDGQAASAAALIPMASTHVIMQAYANLYVHNMWVTVSGNSEELRKAADDLDKLMVANRQLFMQRYNGSEDDLKKMLDEGTTLTAQDCIDCGFADEIVDSIDDGKQTDDVDEEDQVSQKIASIVMQAIDKKLADIKKEDLNPKAENDEKPKQEKTEEQKEHEKGESFIDKFVNI